MLIVFIKKPINTLQKKKKKKEKHKFNNKNNNLSCTVT